MPIYEYKCKKCGERFEAIRPIGDTGRGLSCPECGARAPEKVPSVFAAQGSCAAPSSSGFG
jgi:putative FmdB family regulatory protein